MIDKENADIDYEKIDEYVEYISDIVNDTNFAEPGTYKDTVLRVFSASTDDMPENTKEIVKRVQSILKSSLVYILTILYSESEKKHGLYEEEIEFLKKNDIASDEDDYKESDEGGDAIISFGIDSWANMILTMDKNTIGVLSDYSYKDIYNCLRIYRSAIVDMTKTICECKNTKVDIKKATGKDGRIEFTIDCSEDHSDSAIVSEKQLVPLYGTKFGKKVVDALSEYANEKGIALIVGLDSMSDNKGIVKKNVHIKADDMINYMDMIRNSDEEEYKIKFTEIFMDQLLKIDDDEFDDFMYPDFDPIKNDGDFVESMKENGIIAYTESQKACDEVYVISGNSIKDAGPGIEYVIKFEKFVPEMGTQVNEFGDSLDDAVRKPLA